jgi:hypothetical protein
LGAGLDGEGADRLGARKSVLALGTPAVQLVAVVQVVFVAPVQVVWALATRERIQNARRGSRWRDMILDRLGLGQGGEQGHCACSQMV